MKDYKIKLAPLHIAALLFCNICTAQVPVGFEPHHKIVFQNKYIRVLRGIIPVNDTTISHIHAANSVIVFMSKSRYGIEAEGEMPVISEVTPGHTKYVNYGDKHVTHRVWNQGSGAFEFLVVELLKPPPGKDTCAINDQPGIKLQLQEKFVKTYRISITKKTTFKYPKSDCAYLLIDIGGRATVIKSGVKRSYQAGDFIFFPPHSDIETGNATNEDTHCVLLELRPA